MALDLSGFPVSRATVRFPRRGIPSADVVLVDTPTLAVGSRVSLNVGDVSIVSTLRPGGDFGGTAYWTVVGGAGKWDQPIAARSYHDAGGVLLSRVVADLVRDAGEIGAVLDAPDRSLGTAWTRRAGLASEALDVLTGGEWYMGVDGVTHVGTRPARAVTAPPTLTVDRYDPATRTATLRLADDAVGALLPGAALSAQGLPDTLTIASLIVRAEPGTLDLEAYGERALPDLFADLVRSLLSSTLYHAFAPMMVAEVQGSTASVQAAPGDARAIAIPGSPLLPQAYGVPGVSAVLQQGAAVLVSWQGGDPGSPTVAMYLPGVLPVSVSIDATTSISVGGNVAVADAVKTNLALSQIRSAVNALGGSLPPLGDVGFAKLKGG